jgi:hypothetical protein
VDAVKAKVREFAVDSFLLGDTDAFCNDATFLHTASR